MKKKSCEASAINTRLEDVGDASNGISRQIFVTKQQGCSSLCSGNFLTSEEQRSMMADVDGRISDVSSPFQNRGHNSPSSDDDGSSGAAESQSVLKSTVARAIPDQASVGKGDHTSVDEGEEGQSYLNDLSDVFSSMSVDDSTSDHIMKPDHTHQSLKSDHTHLSVAASHAHISLDSDSTHSSVAASQDPDLPVASHAHISLDPDLAASHTHISLDPDSAHLSVFEMPGDSSKAAKSQISPSTITSAIGQPNCMGCLNEVSDYKLDDLEGFEDEFDSDITYLSVQPDGQEVDLTSLQPNSGVDHQATSACSEGNFKPPSFSTPFRTKKSSNRTNNITNENGALSAMESTSTKLGCDLDKFTSSSSRLCDSPTGLDCGSKIDSHSNSTGSNSSSTRMDFNWSEVESHMDVSMITPDKLPPVQTNSIVKSILKTRHGKRDLDTPCFRKNLSKSVTFKLPSDSSTTHSNNGSSVLAYETPEHLWCTPPHHYGKEAEPGSNTRAEGTYGSNPTYTALACDGAVKSRSNTPAVGTCTSPAGCANGGVTVKSAMTSAHLAECGVVATKLSCTARENTTNVENCTAPDGVRGTSVAKDVCRDQFSAEFSQYMASSDHDFHDSELLELEGVSVLATETPADMWCSPPINFINNTLNNFF